MEGFTILLWLGFLLYIAKIGEEGANALWMKMIAFIFMANAVLFFF